jgi:NADH:ubiquinone oxidoreductase subunit 5 (subunit L)/multisubunit Na+/H+ antiporter MnhA subunit
MSTQPISTKEKKLRNLRKILWIVFCAITITILLVSSLSVPLALLINKTNSFASLFANETGLILLSLLALLLVKIGVTGIICLVIYYIFRYRLEKDDDLFL